MTIAQTIAGRAALLIAVLLAAYQCSDQPESATVNQQLTVAQPMPLPTQDCDPRGCGLIDFEQHPELIGGGLVLEPTEQQP